MNRFYKQINANTVTENLNIRVVRLKISMEEWDCCFYFSFVEVFDSAKRYLKC